MLQAQLETYTHDDLVIRALLFAKISLNCLTAGKDIGGQIGRHHTEIADVWGYTVMHSLRKFKQRYGSWVIEVKATRSDFLADAKKPHRQPGAEALGNYRMYYAAPGIISPDEVPAGWGLVEPWGDHRHRYPVIPEYFPPTVAASMAEVRIAARLSREFELLRGNALQMIGSMGGTDDEDEDNALERTTSSGYRQYSNVIAKYEKTRSQYNGW